MGDYILRKMSVFYPNNLRFLCYDKHHRTKRGKTSSGSKRQFESGTLLLLLTRCYGCSESRSRQSEPAKFEKL